MFEFVNDYLPDFQLPESLLAGHSQRACGAYFATCTVEEMLHVDESFIDVTGYKAEQLLRGGLKWWFSIIHPEDLDPMLRQIIKLCFLRSPGMRLNKPFPLEFRIKKPDGKWAWLLETKCIVSITKEGKNEYVIGILEDITALKEEEERQLKYFLQEQGTSNSMLRAAFPIIDPDLKRRVDPFLAPNQYSLPKGIVKPTDRELDILELIGQGDSTKQMAFKLGISINTVETHRRRLLEKMQVKNSMELIKQTRNAFWLKSAPQNLESEPVDVKSGDRFDH